MNNRLRHKVCVPLYMIQLFLDCLVAQVYPAFFSLEICLAGCVVRYVTDTGISRSYLDSGAPCSIPNKDMAWWLCHTIRVPQCMTVIILAQIVTHL